MILPPPNLCNNCGHPPALGIRVHPRWSLKVGIITRQEDGGQLDLTAYYAHDRASANVLLDTFTADPFCDVIAFEHWNGERWVDIPCRPAKVAAYPESPLPDQQLANGGACS